MKIRYIIIAAVLLAAGALFVGCNLKLEKEGTTPSLEEVAPDFSLVSHTGQEVSLDGLTADGPAVVIFYRGYW